MRFKKLFESTLIEKNVLIIIVSSKAKLKLSFAKDSLFLEGKWKNSGSSYRFRLDKRPPEYGDWQLHIKNRKGEEWLYTKQGKRSEPNRFKSSPTNAVKDIVRTVFDLPSDFLIEVYIKDKEGEVILIESINHL